MRLLVAPSRFDKLVSGLCFASVSHKESYTLTHFNATLPLATCNLPLTACPPCPLTEQATKMGFCAWIDATTAARKSEQSVGHMGLMCVFVCVCSECMNSDPRKCQGIFAKCQMSRSRSRRRCRWEAEPYHNCTIA